MRDPSVAHRRNGVDIGLAGTNPHRLFKRYDEDLPVTDLAGLSPRPDRRDRRLDERVGHRNLEANLLRQPHLYRRSAVCLDAVELAAVALDTGHRYAPYLGAVERLQHVVRLLRPNDPDN